ncbi:hypothetical protein [Nocardiopsis nanhaiensis]
MFQLLLHLFPESAAYLYTCWFGRARLRRLREAHAQGDPVRIECVGRPVRDGAVRRERCALRLQGDRMTVSLSPGRGEALTAPLSRTALHRGDLAGSYAVYGEGEPVEIFLSRAQEVLLMALLPLDGTGQRP